MCDQYIGAASNMECSAAFHAKQTSWNLNTGMFLIQWKKNKVSWHVKENMSSIVTLTNKNSLNSCGNCQKGKIKGTVSLSRLCFCDPRTSLWMSQRLLGWRGTTCRAASRDVAAMQKSSGLLSIDQPDCVSAHLFYFLRQKKMAWDDPTRHVTPSWAAPVENGAPDKWVCSDEQLMEWLAKVMTTGGGRRSTREAGGWKGGKVGGGSVSPSLPSHFDLEQRRLLQMADNLSQRSTPPRAARIHHWAQTLSSLLAGDRLNLLAGAPLLQNWGRLPVIQCSRAPN